MCTVDYLVRFRVRSLTFNLLVSLNLKCTSCRQQIFFFIQSDNICFLSKCFHLFTFNIIHAVGFLSAVLLFVFYVSCFSVSLVLFYCLLLH